MGCVLSSDWCGEGEVRPVPVVRSSSLKRRSLERSESGRMRLTKAGKGEPHVFKEKTFKKKRQCSVCRQNVDSVGSFCRVCKTATHRKCEAKVTSACIPAPSNDLQRRGTTPSRHIQHLGSTKSLSYTKQRNTLPRSFSVDRVMERVMERHYDFDLTYITERIISVFFPPRLEEQRYRLNLKEVAAMLKSKHQDKFLLLNLSERRHDISRLNPKVHDFGWPDLHAPPLDKICAICKAMETWLTSDPQHVVVLHCKGNKGKTGVIIAAYMHYSKISAGADQALSTLAMRKFCEDKVSSSLQPSQNRWTYIYYFGGLLSGAIKMNSSPLFLHQVLIPSLPNFQGEGGSLFVLSSVLSDLQGTGGRRLCVTVEPALLLKGDIMVKCYHRRSQTADRDTVFRLQFHTCTIHGSQLWFGKGELDEACMDERFPSDATVEFVFSSGPEKIKGRFSREYQKNDPAVTVDYNTADPVVRWDSYENFNQRYQDSLEGNYIAHTRGPLDGSLYAQIKKRRGPGSEDRPDHLYPQGSDSALSAHSLHLNQLSIHPDHQEEPVGPPPPTRQEREELERLLGGIEGNRDGERETAILDDGDSLPSERTGTLRLNRSCSCRDGYRSQRCAEPGCDRTLLMPNGYCLDRAPGTNGHHGATPSATPNPASPPSHMDLCQHYTHSHQSLPPPDLVWDLLILISFYFSPSPGGREYDIRTTDIIGSDYEAPQPQEGHYRANNIVQESSESQRSSRESSLQPVAKETHTATSQQAEPQNHNPAPTDPSAPQQQDCSPSVDSVAPSNQRHCQVPSSPVHASPAPDTPPQPLNLQTISPSEAAAVPQPQPRTQSTSSTGSAQVGGSSPTREPQPEAPKSTTSHPASPPPSSSPQPASSSVEGSPISDTPVPGFATLGRRLMLSGSEPHQQGPPHHHYPLHPPSYSNYSTISIPLPHPQPPLPEKRHLSAPSGSPGDGSRPAIGHVTPPTQHQHHVTFSPTVGEIAPPAGQNDASVEAENRVSVKFVQDSSRFWYKPGISREQAIAALKEREPGTFLIRDSNSFQGAYGLALKVATPPPNINSSKSKVSDPLEQLVRHFLIETGPRGVKIKGCQNEPYFGSLSALVYQHSITPISLPCSLKIPEKDLIGEVQEVQPVSNISTAADLLKQGAACNVLYLNSVETESLTGPQAIAKATDATLGRNPRPAATVVQFKVTSQGITLTDSQRRVFFRRHYPVNSVTFSSIDPKDRRWTNSDNTTVKVFGFVAKKPGSLAENVCHLFAELDPEQPASAIVNFINKVMLSQRR
uniref:Tensin 2a n=1 Tax=Amphiprion ocellaris TaxID=80972 RepID=A0AAQ5XI13_AMPOC